ncbi:8-amino-7-oxononanoate synthase [Legionella antarctica]|uniref:8-amino-7-oxononanoate synthase n=1 Tax=Legionella antarctica TaxID=2708020 RepID=A0A6F8T640_9GAMM|nr:aminotransferase class I/II-fold pyridoxal phosphate-dependent enzyme [Legionella antarctica]BCA95617.1 8-amino-7-oxononanoate synthase [Legionella antarctica]
MSLTEKVKSYTEQLNQQGLLRVRQLYEPANSALIHFDSNDYLSLTHDKRLAKAYQDGYALYPVGSGASMLLSGYHPNHHAVEHAFANLLSVDECILFSSGYAANLALTALLGKLKIHSLIDKSIHASVYDGLALSRVSYSRYRHNDLNNLALKLKAVPFNSVVYTEGVFSMSGRIAPLSKISDLCFKNKTELLVDEAHSFGVFGNQGKGAVDYHGLTQKEVPLRIIPFGKAFASQGALIAGKKEWIDALLQTGRSLVYSTAISPALSYGLLKTLDIVASSDDRRQKLAELIKLFREHIKRSPLQWSNSETPIQQLQLECPHLALHYAKELKKEGFSCSAIRTPTVNIKSTGLRVILNYRHQPEQIQQLFKKLHDIDEHTH